MGWEWICTAHGVVVDVVVVVVVVGDLLLLIAGLYAPTAAAPNKEGDEDDDKDPPPLALNHFSSEGFLKCASCLHQDLDAPVERAHFFSCYIHFDS